MYEKSGVKASDHIGKTRRDLIELGVDAAQWRRHDADLAARVAAKVLGEDNIDAVAPPDMASEDFAFMLNERPGCYIWLGNGGDGELGGCSVHNPYYDFNDNILALGASYWATLVETALPKDG